MLLVSIQTGAPRTYDDPKPWTSAIKKDPVAGQVWAGSGLASVKTNATTRMAKRT